MNVTMNMSDYEIKHETIEAEYGDEILCAGWNPEVDSVRRQLQLVPTIEQRAMPAALTMEVAEQFLRMLYAYQR